MKKTNNYINKNHKISSAFQDNFCLDKTRSSTRGRAPIKMSSNVNVDIDDSSKKSVIEGENYKHKPNHNSNSGVVDGKENVHLNIVTARKMIARFLVEKKMSMEQLAKVLKVDEKSLDQLFSSKVSLESISSISLPLIKLYCTTEWARNKE